MKQTIFFAGILVFLLTSLCLKGQAIISEKNEAGAFAIAGSRVSAIYTDENDDWLVQKSAELLQQDIERVAGKKPALLHKLSPAIKNVIIIGTLSGSATINQLITEKKLQAADVKNKWEAFTLQTISKPSAQINNALVIAGSDKRGAAYGVFELSKQMGVSPWYWWADVPAQKKREVYVKKGIYNYGSPSVKYRGIFINDEAPAFSGWTKEKFGGVNHLVYEKMFELLLRLKGNYLWPAMWGNAFNDDDTLNPVLANKWGIVMGTSHHEPMLRAQQEWKRYGKGAWNYATNDSVLRAFWTKGIQNMDHHESIVTVGMRGDGDMPMTEGTAISLLEKIVGDQRKIIEDVTGKPAAETPQLWALYKEVLEYYDKGMRVPDDVTLLLCDDNWGNIRRLPQYAAEKRAGGYGIYYHFDYVGDPRNYKWINTNNISRVWEQMHLAYENGVDKIWIVNVGDLKPMEFPISFFLDYAWDVGKWNESNILDYYTQWATTQFGPKNAKEIAVILRNYSQYSSRRKPELLDDKTYSLKNYDEWNSVTDEWTRLEKDAEELNKKLPAEYRDAFFQLVLHPVKAFCNLHQLYRAVAFNHFYAKENDPLANQYAADAKRFYAADSLISLQYNQLNHGKWHHMMDQTHIGYTYWQQPDQQKMPDLEYVENGSSSKRRGTSRYQSSASLIPADSKENVFYELNGYIAMEAAHFSAKVNTDPLQWKIIPNIGREGDGITLFPVNTAPQQITASSPYLAYNFYSYDTGAATINAYFSPTLNFHNRPEGLQFAIAIDDEQPKIISINDEDKKPAVWSQWVANNIIIKSSEYRIFKKGKHTLKFWGVTTGFVLQKLLVDFGGLKPSYLGPPETRFIATKK